MEPGQVGDGVSEGRQDVRWFLRGSRSGLGLPAVSLVATMISVGGLANEAGFPLGAAVLSTLLMWAGPAQVILFGSVMAGASLPAAALAVSLSSLRFLPMTMSVLPLVRRQGFGIWQMLFTAHFVSVSPWVEALRQLPPLPTAVRLPYFLGFGVTVLTAATLATAAGFMLVGGLPGPLAIALLFMTPLFFTAATAKAARQLMDWLALGLGLLLAPVVFWLLPNGIDFLACGLLGGTLAYAIDRVRRKRV